MLNIYIGKLLKLSYLPLLYPNLGRQTKASAPFTSASFKNFDFPFVNLTEDIEKADYILIPHNYFIVKNIRNYLSDFISLSKKYNKKIIIFAYGDSDEDIDIPNSIIFRTSQYGYKKKENEIIMPAYVEDLADGRESEFRKKNEGQPVVGFCGWASVAGVKKKISLFLKTLLIDLKKIVFLNGKFEIRKKGIYFRKKAIKVLNNSSLIDRNFIIRKTYSGYINTDEIDVKTARQEYIENIISSDFCLTAKGDGNFSDRFYEILSLGRIPVLIDTDCVFPMENIVDYSNFILRINYKDINKIDKTIADFYSKITNEEFLEMQKKARNAFEDFLKIDAFFRTILKKLEASHR